MGWKAWDRLLVVGLPLGSALLVVSVVLLGTLDEFEGTPFPVVLFVGTLYVVGRMVHEADRARQRLRLRKSAANN